VALDWTEAWHLVTEAGSTATATVSARIRVGRSDGSRGGPQQGEGEGRKLPVLLLLPVLLQLPQPPAHPQQLLLPGSLATRFSHLQLALQKTCSSSSTLRHPKQTLPPPAPVS
jgi:hypothetical protein